MKALAAILALAMAMPAWAEDARLLTGASSVTQAPDGWWQHVFGPEPLEFRLVLDAPVPWRVFLVGDPARLVVDLKGVDLRGNSPRALFGQELLPAIRWGAFRRGWARMVFELPGPYRVTEAGMNARSPEPGLRILLDPVSEEAFAPRPSAAAALRNLPDPADIELPERAEGLVVTLDPGHGGFDPGAQAGGETEAVLVLTFAKELRDALQARGVTVNMTRDRDVYVGLESRMTTAREGGSHLMLSLHADALPKGQAAGATVYVWNTDANARAARQLGMRHDRADLLSGMDLAGEDDALATALMDFARTDTQPRSDAFARLLASRMALKGIGLHGRPIQGAAFSVLKSPDIASVLLELGFLSDPNDRQNLTDPIWRGRMVEAVADATLAWGRDEGARAQLLRR
ncbi:N-acetylmuramoyl-L-alanine amidase [Paracoccus sp. 1_MG-2023]|uniref:N-acetylmuramoyl-L-alanine amidase n=1 Tax=unclassified Paracoccus (in: a-proteobacteria) TaxID=2688777 RepID=UPI001C0A58AF|nr:MULTISPECIES: N-acetylmuramoyl-L-alanine amidase [unclassified Paracoccus (in: a-proteobacteria)]MBU2958580.1 N-acetylmuramoyl-L-alanine amidase [Paracoccus sp. C2R09]MDO6667573.1 N-acetylmuramoyl-L-alanine amidase [Paracoccus sp. 1_MG-2023]